MIQQEIWKDIEGYEGLYQVSNLGQVRSVDRTYHYLSTIGKPYSRFYKGQIVTQSCTVFEGQRTNYKTVTLSNRSKAKNFLVHRLVAQAFIPNPDNLPQVNHKDENPSNNCVENLEWCSASYNVNYGCRNQSVSNALSSRAKSPESIAKMRESLKGHTPWNKGLHTRPITCLDANIEFACAADAAKWLGEGTTGAAVEYVAKRIACCKGHVFVYSDDIPEDIEMHIQKCLESYRKGTKAGRPLRCIEDNKIFKFITEAAQFYGISHNLLHGKLLSGKGVALADGRIVHFERISFEAYAEYEQQSQH